jgi:hypothetical protein
MSRTGTYDFRACKFSKLRAMSGDKARLSTSSGFLMNSIQLMLMSDTIDLPVFTLKRDSSPLLISIPHLGRKIRAPLADIMMPVAQHYDDTDWHLDRLYAFAEDLSNP